MGSGGSSSGAIEYPEYMQTKHGEWLDQIDTALGGVQQNPYAGFVMPEPSTLFGTCQTPCSILADLVAFDPTIDVSADIQTVYDAVKDDWVTEFPQQEIDDLITALGVVLQNQQDANIGRFEQEAINGGAVLSSAFIYARNTLADDVQDRLTEISKSISLEAVLQKQKLDFDKTTQARSHAHNTVDLQNRNYQVHSSHLAHASHYAVDTVRVIWGAESEKAKTEVEQRSKESTWPIDRFEGAARMLAAIAGAGGVKPPEGSTIGNALSGALSGAAAGAQTGNPYAVAGGAVLGGLAGIMG